MTLVGWAERPSYDKANHKLYWAKELKAEGSQQDSLNYNIRVLGRKGVLVLNAVAGMDQIAKIRTEMKQVTAFSEFTDGNRYADFDSHTDKTAEYGIAALVRRRRRGQAGPVRQAVRDAAGVQETADRRHRRNRRCHQQIPGPRPSRTTRSTWTNKRAAAPTVAASNSRGLRQ